MGESKLQRKLSSLLSETSETDFENADLELPFEMSGPEALEDLLDEGADHQFAVYSTVQQNMMAMAVVFENSPMANDYHAAVEAGVEKYMPAFPPMSPITDSYFYLSALFDLKFGKDQDNISQLITQMLTEMGGPVELLTVAQNLVNSRMGIYETLGVDDDRLVVRELVTDRQITVDPPTGFMGHEGQLRFVRLASPLHNSGYYTELTTPYILINQTPQDWTAYLNRVMPDKVTMADGSTSAEVEQRLAAVFKDDLGTIPWHDFVFDGYHHYEPEAIFLSGIPDQPESLPCGEETVATSSTTNIDSDLLRKAKSMGITIIPPEGNTSPAAGMERTRSSGVSAEVADSDADVEVALTSAQRVAASELMPGFSDRFCPETKGKKRVRLDPEHWNILANLASAEIKREHGRRITRLRNLRDAIVGGLSEDGSLPSATSTSKSEKKTGDKNTTENKIFRLRIELTASDPLIWREIEIPDCSFAQLHLAIQTAMGWDNSHLHEFIIGQKRYSIPDPFGDFGEAAIDSTTVRLSDVIRRKGKKFRYVYDFGDDWQHAIQVQSIGKADSLVSYPRCVAGERNCPPEDCGGIWGFHELLEIVSDPKHPEYEERIEWCGHFDPQELDLSCTTERMQAGYSNESAAPDDFEIDVDFFAGGDLDEEAFYNYSHNLQARFTESPEFENVPEEHLQFVDCVLHYSMTFLGATPASMSVTDLDELLFSIIPRKVMMGAEDAGDSVSELRWFFEFVHREYSIAGAKVLADELSKKETAKKFAAELEDQSNFGMAKSFTQMGMKAGFDMTSQEGLNEFMVAYNSQLSTGNHKESDEPAPEKLPSTPRLVSKNRTGRNEPCPCGSGRKFKKCCLNQ